MARLFTADPHFGHSNIIGFCGRPYPNLMEMEKDIKLKWNAAVTSVDDVYIMGDFCFGSLAMIKSILKKLNGRKHLILGNHDNEKWSDYIRAGFSSVQRYAFLDFPIVGPVGLAHDPSCCIVDQSCPWIVGHLHQQFEKMNNCINAGVDVRNFTPVTEAEMVELLIVTKKFHMKLDPNASKEFGAAHGLKNH